MAVVLETLGDWIFISIFTIFSIISFFCYIYFLFYWTKNKHLIGNNFWLIIIFDTLLIMFLPIGGIIKGFWMIFIDGSNSPQFTSFLMAFGSTAYRFTAISIIIERFFATNFAKNYENNKKFKYLAFFINTFTLVTIFAVSFIIVYIRINTTDSLIAISSMSVLAVTLCFLIVKRNQTLRKQTRDNPMLQQRYQLAQNIRLMRFIQPYVILKAFISIAAISIMIIFLLFSNNISYAYLILNGTYHIGTFIKVAIILYLNKKQRKKCHGKISTVSELASTKTVVTTLGEELPTHLTVDKYFNELKNTWN